jgi:hypothetical protein
MPERHDLGPLPDPTETAEALLKARGAWLRAGDVHQAELRRSAYHEAGHIVVAHLDGVPFSKATIIEGADFAGRVTMNSVSAAAALRRVERASYGDFSLRDRERIEAHTRATLAGGLAELRLIGEPDNRWKVGISHDDARVFDFLNAMSRSPAQTETYSAWLTQRVTDELQLPHVWRCVEAVAAALQVEGTLGRARLLELIDAAVVPPQDGPHRVFSDARVE